MTDEMLLDAAQAALRGLADPAKATPMAAYMKHRFAFLGVQTPLRRQATRSLIRSFAGDPLAAAGLLWRLDEREFQYLACDLLAHHTARLGTEALDGVLELAVCKSWWDTVDSLAHVVGDLVRRERRLVARIDQLIEAPDFWLRRIALLHQIGWKGDTDTMRLFDYCLRQAGEREFFIRKAIGWALRDLAWHDAQAVRDFLASASTRLSPLSRREAARNLDRSR